MSSKVGVTSTSATPGRPEELVVEPGAPQAQLPALIPAPRAQRARHWLALLAAAATAAALVGGAYWWTHRMPPLPPGIAYGNGRLEADPINISTKFPGRIAELKADEGDTVRAGQTLALMDTRDLEQSLEKAQSDVRLQQKSVSEGEAVLDQIRSQVVLAEQQMERTRALVANGFASKEVFDQRQQQLAMARAMERAGTAKINQLQNALQGSLHEVELLKVNIADNRLVAPRDGRIEYRTANIGEVLPAGGNVFTLLDASYVYMDIYLPTRTAGQIRMGADARIVLDAYPTQPLRAKVTFVSPRAQFTPKMVETQSERDKLMFRVRVRIETDQLQANAAQAPSGIPGLAYVRFDPSAEWPAPLRGTP